MTTDMTSGSAYRHLWRYALPLMLGNWFQLCYNAADSVIAGLFIGARYLGAMAVFYLLPAFTNGFQGYFRGMGRLGVTLLGTLIQTSLRVVFTMLLAPRLGILGIAFACAGGWCVMLLVEVPLYLLRMRGREGAA